MNAQREAEDKHSAVAECSVHLAKFCTFQYADENNSFQCYTCKYLIPLDDVKTSCWGISL